MSFSLGESDADDGLGAPRVVSDINVTPFVDVMLVLLIVFMVTAPMLAAGVKVDLPKASGAAAISPAREPLVVTVKADGSVFVGADALGGAGFDAAIAARLGADPKVTAHIRADAAVPYEKVLDVMAALSRDGVSRLAFIGKADRAAPSP
ncbi:ExbD/TolR family protein [Labrys monachus]|uniref:Biopolymer transport protein ExbD n=1 Tax=Labrys monachus TaxID=217067 RepID=A0ABU0FAD8_9HYPH|nr:ExbD/TolR family protein [Labrys monachus]MDQ0391583.1 biopolymer transport protein ExbD [Labrys monachus]